MNHSELMEIGAIAIGALALLVVLRRGGSPDAAPVSDSAGNATAPAPTYLTYNTPSAYAGNSAGVPATALSPIQGRNSSAGKPCACGSAPVNFSSLNSFADALVATDQNIVNSYQSQILAAMPSWIGQFINNTFAPDETAASQGGFSQFAASA